jgi:glycerol-3-phosphate dehydrogenase
MNGSGWRDEVWSRLDEPWDLIVVGGGITGAGILHEAARCGLRVLLLEQGDFASGTSSRSSKLVHGGLRYLREGDVKLTWESVRERDRLLEEAAGLVEPIGFLLANYRGESPGRGACGVGLWVYDLLGSSAAGVRHRRLESSDLLMMAPRLRPGSLTGGFWYRDAQTDDARLVLRVLAEALRGGAQALNHVRVEEVVLRDGTVHGVAVRDRETGRVARLTARCVVNATGAWADRLRDVVGGRAAIRPLRGSHLLFPAWRFPVAQAVTFAHPADHRPLFAYPWEGVTLLGTTDLDHERPLEDEPEISPREAAYLVGGARAAFPGLNLRAADAVSAFSGVRPVIGTGKADPSHESREHVIWDERGLVTVTGGKLTTFRRIARDTLRVLRNRLPELRPRTDAGGLRALPLPAALTAGLEALDARRLAGRYGVDAVGLLERAQPGELTRIPGTAFLWAELRWAAAAERVVHLDDLLLRRVRAGLLLPEGGRELLPRVRAICQAALGWDNLRWFMEEERYLDSWRRHLAPPSSLLALCA